MYNNFMEKSFYNIAIYTNNSEITNYLKNYHDYIIIDSSYKIIDSYLAKSNNQELSFDYLITDNKEVLETIGVIFDNGYALTNSTFTTTIENTYAFGDIVNSNKTILEQLQIINDAIND